MRKVLCAVALLALGGAGAAVAATGAGKPKEPTLKVTPAHFVMKWTQCEQLPEGLVVTGNGTKRHYDYSTTDESGVTHSFVVNLITGRATDNEGGTYWFDYHDTLTANFVKPPFVGLFTDHFSLVPISGSSVHVHSFFAAKARVGTSSFSLHKAFIGGGHPISYGSNIQPHCDPL
jgi:hypothetical protein